MTHNHRGTVEAVEGDDDMNVPVHSADLIFASPCGCELRFLFESDYNVYEFTEGTHCDIHVAGSVADSLLADTAAEAIGAVVERLEKELLGT